MKAKVAPSAETAWTHRPSFRGCKALLDLPEWPTGGFCGEPGKLCRNCASDLTANLIFRESGGSIPAEAPAGYPFPAELPPVADVEPPLLNKSGGSDVPVFTVVIARCPKCGHESGGMQPEPGAVVQCPKCGHRGQLAPTPEETH